MYTCGLTVVIKQICYILRCRHNYNRPIGKCQKLKGCKVHIRPVLNMFGRLALLLVPGGSLKAGA